MSTKISYKTMTHAELIDEGLDCNNDSLAYELAVTMDTLPIRYGMVYPVENVTCDCSSEDCDSCSDLQNEVDDLERDISSLRSDLEKKVAHVDKIKLKAASCPDCKAPINADDFKDLAEQTIMNGGAYAQAYFCKTCDHLMVVNSSSSTTVTLTTTEPKP
jgi:hypothetical protein